MKSFLETLDRPVIQIAPIGSKIPPGKEIVKWVFDFDTFTAIIVPKELSRATWERVRQTAPAGFSLKPGLAKEWGVWAVLARSEWAKSYQGQEEPDGLTFSKL